MNKINFTPFPTLETERLYLRQLAIEDLNEYFILKSDERLLKYYDAKPRTYDEARLKMENLNDEIARNESITWGIILKSENKLIGTICFWNISEEQSKAEIGYELMFDCQGKGVMQEAVKAVIEYGFNGMNLQWIEAFPNPHHLKSVKLLERNHFTRGEDFTEIDPSSGKALERIVYLLRRNSALW